MNIVRAIAGVLIGYFVYAYASMTLVGAIMGSEGTATVAMALAALAAIGALAGALAALVAGPKAAVATTVAAGLVVLATLANLILKLGAEPVWFKVGTLLLTAPILCLVGRRLARRAA